MPLSRTLVTSSEGVSPRDQLSGAAQSICRAATVEAGDKRQQKRPRISFKIVIMAMMGVFTVGPAISLWMISWQAGMGGVTSVYSLGQSSVEVRDQFPFVKFKVDFLLGEHMPPPPPLPGGHPAAFFGSLLATWV